MVRNKPTYRCTSTIVAHPADARQRDGAALRRDYHAHRSRSPRRCIRKDHSRRRLHSTGAPTRSVTARAVCRARVTGWWRKRQGRSRAPPSESCAVQQFGPAIIRFTCRAVVHRLRCSIGARALGIRDRHVDLAATLAVDCIMNGGRYAPAGHEAGSTSRGGSSWRRLRKVGVPLITLPFLAFFVGSRAMWPLALVL